MKKIQFDICNGLDNIVLANSKDKPTIKQGVAVVLRLNKAEVHVGIDSTSEDGDTYFGKVLEIEQQTPANKELSVGDKISFIIENIAYPLDNDKSIT
ncbi:MAG: hypothetical protein J7K84_05925 [Deltaproteobacteria bacterium]|nr:hypothetical protein [Deltaproteobacteria bacterium]